MSKEPSIHEQQPVVANNDDGAEIAPVPTLERVTVVPKGNASPGESSSGRSSGHEIRHGAVVLTGADPAEQPPIQVTTEEVEGRKKGRFAFLKTKRFYLILFLSQALAVADTGTNTLTTLLADNDNSVPAFQSLFNYILLTLIYSSYTIYKLGFKGWLKLMLRDGWKYFLLAFCDVQGNYFTVLAYRYTNILQAQLINFWAIAVVVLVSLIFLKVRYHIAQYVGIGICCAGLGLLLVSAYLEGSGFDAAFGTETHPVKGDLFALLGATGYGLSNVFEEFFVSKRPLYEVIGQLSWWGMCINGVQAAIFNRRSFRAARWGSKNIGYMAGYTLILTWFYSTAPIVFRMASAAFFNIGLLTGNFWGVIVGVHIFHDKVQYLYPVAFVLIIGGHFVYYGTEGVLGEAKKPWLGENQEGGSDGLGTARRQLEKPDVIV